MNRVVSVLAVVLVASAVAMVAWFPGHADVSPARVLRAPVSAVVGSEGGSWYCAARDVGAGDAELEHLMYLGSAGETAAEVRLDGFSGEERVGSSEVTVAPGTTSVVDVASELGAAGLSVMAESDAPLVVEHRFTFDGGADQAPCSTFSSDRWYFPVAVTTRDATARLNLFNPFPGDASVDVEVALETGVRAPDKLSGIVVGAGSTKVVNLEEFVERREQFTATVQTRSGGVVAELAQRFDGSNDDRPVEGLRLVPGVRSTAPRWSFAGGFADPAATERLVIQNPADEEAEALAQLIPFGGSDVMPEPFELAAPPRRYAVVDLDADSRVPAVGYHALDLETGAGGDVVAGRSINVIDEPEADGAPELRKAATSGTTASSGLSVAAADWIVGGLRSSEAVDGTVFVHNPGAGTVTVSVVGRFDGKLGEAVDYELPAGESVAVDLASLGGEDVTFAAEVHADGPVVVERLLVFLRAPDISVQSGVPILESLEDLVVLGG